MNNSRNIILQNDVMIDIETLSTRSHAVILVIAGIKFNRYEMTMTLDEIPSHDKFYKRVVIDSCIKKGMHVDSKTEQWWDEQDESIRNEALGNDKKRVSLSDALTLLRNWFGKSTYVWSHGASFDIPIISEAYSRCNLAEPWKFWNIRDTRTVYDVFNVRNKDLPQNQKHNAMYDCFRQIVGVQMAFNRLVNKDKV